MDPLSVLCWCFPTVLGILILLIASLIADRTVKSITVPAGLTPEVVAKIEPQWIFVPHRALDPDAIWSEWPTVIFHMTDLPYGGRKSSTNLSSAVTKARCLVPFAAGRTRYR